MLPWKAIKGCGAPAALVASACSSHVAVPAAPPASPAAPVAASSPCQGSGTTRARADALWGEGKLHRTLRVIERARARCPDEAPATWDLELRALAELGRRDDALRLADTIEASPVAPEAARDAARAVRVAAEQTPHTDAGGALALGRKLHAAGHDARLAGDRAGAQRLFDRAVEQVERATGAEVRISLPTRVRSPVEVRWSPDQRTLAIAGYPDVVLLDAASGHEVRRLEGHRGQVDDVAFSRDGREITSVGGDGSLRRWLTETGAQARVPVTGERFSAHRVAFSPDGTVLAAADWSGSVQLWDVEAGEPLGTLDQTQVVEDMAFSPDGATLVSTGQDGVLHLWAVHGAREIRALKGHTAAITGLAFLGGGAVLVSSSKDATIRLWDLRKARPLRVLATHREPIAALAAAPSQGVVAIAGGASGITLLDGRTGRVMRELRAARPVRALAFSPDGRRLAGTLDGDIAIWDEGDPSPHVVGEASSLLWCAALSPDQTSLAFGGDDGNTAVWDLRTGEPFTLPPPVKRILTVAFSPDSDMLVTGYDDGTTRVWTGRGRALARVLGGHRGAVHAVAVSPSGKIIATGSNDHTIRLWSAATGDELRVLDEHDGDVTAVLFAGEHVLVSGSWDRSVIFWDVERGSVLHQSDRLRSSVEGLALSPGGDAIAAVMLQVLQIWNPGTHETLGVVKDSRWLFTSAAFLPDGSTVAAGLGSGEVNLVDVATGELRRTLRASRDRVTAVVPGAHNDVLITAAFDGVLRLWRPSTGALLAVLSLARDGRASYVVTPEGLADVHGDAAGAPACRFGALILPLELCEERFLSPGLAAKIWSGGTSYLDP